MTRPIAIFLAVWLWTVASAAIVAHAADQLAVPLWQHLATLFH